MDIFELDPNATFVAPVALPRPGLTPVVVDFRFRHKDEEAFYAMLRDSKEKQEDSATFLARFVDGWEGDKINAAFSLDALAKLVRNYPLAAKAIFLAYQTELVGAPAKN